MFKTINKYYTVIRNLNNKRDKNIWVFVEWFGNRCGDNSTALANYVATQCPDINVIWIDNGSKDIELLNDRIDVCKKDSAQSIDYLKKAAVVVMTHGIGETNSNGFNYSGNALKVNLWHGVMWKKLGYDMSDSVSIRDKCHIMLRNHIKRNYLFESPSEQYTEIFKKAFAVNKNEIINAGQPRNSIFYNNDEIQEAKKMILARISKYTNIEGNPKIITYMPTFRDNNNVIFNFENALNINQIDDMLEKHNAIIIQKMHYVSSNKNIENSAENHKRIIGCQDLPSQLLLASTDILITDYSSCFFDFLLLDRPIIHYLYDYDYYSNKDRGLYYTYDEVNCGEVVFDEDHLLNAIVSAFDDPQKDEELRKNRREKFQMYESVDSCKIIVDEIMRRLI